jgi:TatD DNase family protein
MYNAPVSSLFLVDTHAHLDMDRFDDDRVEVIERAHAEGVTTIVTVGIDLPSSRSALALAQANPMLRPAVGIHPQEIKESTEGDLKEISILAETPGVVAVGEIGLDYYRNNGRRDKQMEVLRYQLNLASRLNLPVILHCRAADEDFSLALEQWVAGMHPERLGIIHCFSESLANARTFIEMGFYLGLGGYIGYPSSKGLRDVVKQLPLERLVLETDCPFLPPQRHRGQRNEPAFITETAQELARIKGLEVSEVARVTGENARAVFSFS